MLQQRDVLFACSQLLPPDGCYNRGTCYLHGDQPFWTRWMLQQTDLLFACSQPCIFQLETAADGLAGVAGHFYCSDGCCSRWTYYLHIDVVFQCNSDARRKIPGVTINF